jgi:hypothetical protein
MTPERWKRTEELYHAADALPPDERAAFLAEACSGDEALRRDVESLLTESESDGGFPDAPSLAAGARAVRPRLPMAGCLGNYRWRRCSAPGHGEYRARDVKLGRDVDQDPARVHEDPTGLRLSAKRDACGAQSSQHLRYTAGRRRRFAPGTELVEGHPGDSLRVCRPPPEGAAGRRSTLRGRCRALPTTRIVHRDQLNIKITAVSRKVDSRAKAVYTRSPRPPTFVPEASESGPHSAVTAPAYMSPEQARGTGRQAIDIWAFVRSLLW